MAIETQCGGCGKRLRVGDQFAGRKARCPECGYVYSVPGAGAAGADSPTTPSAEQPLPGPASPSQQPASNHPLGNSSAGTVSQSPAQDAWYLKTPEGQIYGPVDRGELGRWVDDGRVSEDCQLRRGEHGDWNGAAQIFPQLSRPSAAQQSGGVYANPYSARQSSIGNLNAGRYVRPHRGGLILAFALLGWFVCPIFSIVAWSMGNTDVNQMRAGLMDQSGMGLTQAGQVIGMIHVCLTVLGFGLVFLLAMCGAMAEGM